LADLFFITDKSELVLIDITGGNINKVQKKRENLNNWIRKEQLLSHNYTLYGIVLAPNIKDPLPTAGNQFFNVVVVAGSKAINLLGGLGQIWRWLLWHVW
jgi:hypothetical protein